MIASATTHKGYLGAAPTLVPAASTAKRGMLKLCFGSYRKESSTFADDSIRHCVRQPRSRPWCCRCPRGLRPWREATSPWWSGRECSAVVGEDLIARRLTTHPFPLIILLIHLLLPTFS